MFAQNYLAVKRFNQLGDWFADVDMHSGAVRRQIAENLQAFWPGLESLLGLTRTSARFLNALYSVLSGVGFMPEEFDYLRWQLPASASGSSSYLLRPELIESTYLHYRSTHDRSWLTPGKWFLESLDDNTKTLCGYANVESVDSMKLSDSMPSYFLAETAKYLYLLFDEDNFVHSRPFIFSTEAHMFDALELNRIHLSMSSKTGEENFEQEYDSLEVPVETYEAEPAEPNIMRSSFSDMLELSLFKCPRKMWWEKEGCFNPDFEDVIAAPLGKAFDIDMLRHNPSHISFNPHEELFCPPKLFDYLDRSESEAVTAGQGSSCHSLGGTCAAVDELFHRPNVDGPNEGAVDNEDSSNKALGIMNISPDYYSFEELRSDGRKISQTVAFEVGTEGEFIVDVYSFGFSIYSSKYQNLLHIFNLGGFSVFSTERNNILQDVSIRSETISEIDPTFLTSRPNKKSLVIGETSGHVRRCHIELALPKSLRDFESSEYSEVRVEVDELGNAYGIRPTRASVGDGDELILSRDVCSPAVFGRTSIEYSASPVKIIAPLIVAPDMIGCAPPKLHVSREEFSINESDDTGRISPYEGMVVLVERGKCTFEEKVMYAQNAGAIGIVIINTEVPKIT